MSPDPSLTAPTLNSDGSNMILINSDFWRQTEELRSIASQRSPHIPPPFLPWRYSFAPRVIQIRYCEIGRSFISTSPEPAIMHACHESRRTGADTANPLYTRIECQTQDECGMSLRRMVYWVNWDADTIFLVDKATASTFMQQRGYYGSHAINENCIHFALPMTSWPEIDRAWNTRHHLPSMNTLTLAVPIPDSAPTPTTGSSIRLVGLTPYSVPRRVLGVLTTDPACAVRARLWCFKEQLPMLERATVMSVRHQDPRVLSGEEKKQEYKRREMVRGRKTQVERDLEYATRLALDLELEGRARRRAERHREAKVKLTEEAPPISE